MVIGTDDELANSAEMLCEVAFAGAEWTCIHLDSEGPMPCKASQFELPWRPLLARLGRFEGSEMVGSVTGAGHRVDMSRCCRVM